MSEPQSGSDIDDPAIVPNDGWLEGLEGFNTSRRKLMLASATGAATASLAGCTSGLTGGDGGTTPTDTPEAENYVVTSHTYVTSDISNYQANGFAQPCAPQRQFVPGQRIGFRVGVYDADTGKILGNDTIDAVSITFEGPSDLPELKLDWAGDNEEHPAKEWSAAVNQEATKGAKPGKYKYTIHVTNGAANIYKVGIAANTFTLLDPEKVPTATPTTTESSS